MFFTLIQSKGSGGIFAIITKKEVRRSHQAIRRVYNTLRRSFKAVRRPYQAVRSMQQGDGRLYQAVRSM